MRWLIRAGMSLVVLVVLLGGMVIFMPKDRVLELAANRFAEATGRKISIGSGAKVALWPVLGVKAGPVKLSNADWGSEPDMLTAENMAVGLDVAALLSGQLQITEISLTRPDLLLERHADGRVNWAIDAPPAGDAAAAPAGAQPGRTAGFTLGSAVIRDGKLRYREAGMDLQFEEVNLATAIPDITGPVTVTGAALYNGQPVEVSVGVAALAAFLEGEPAALELSVSAGGNRMAFKGRAGSAPRRVDGAVDLALADKPALATLLGRPLPDLPTGLGARSLSAKGKVKLGADDVLRLSGMEVVADDSRWQVDASWRPGPQRPKLVARLATDRLVLAADESGGGSGAGGGGSGWSDDRIDASGLGLLDAEIDLTTGALQLGGMRLGATTARLVLDNRRVVTNITRSEAYGGALSGALVVNARKGLSASADLTLHGLDLQGLLSDMLGQARMAGKADLRLKLLGSGNSQAALLRSLSGDAALTMGQGELVGFDVAGMLRTMDPGYVGDGRKTIFDALSVSTVIEKGVARSDDLALAGKLFSASGKGRVDLGQRTVDYRLLPSLTVKGDVASAITVPVLISGPWADPKVRLDLEWLAGERAREERARAEAAAKARLEELAQDKLGVDRQTGESLEDAAKRRAQEALEAEAGRLLERALGGN